MFYVRSWINFGSLGSEGRCLTFDVWKKLVFIKHGIYKCKQYGHISIFQYVILYLIILTESRLKNIRYHRMGKFKSKMKVLNSFCAMKGERFLVNWFVLYWLVHWSVKLIRLKHIHLHFFKNKKWRNKPYKSGHKMADTVY